MSTAIEARSLKKDFGADGIVDGVNLAVEENEILLLMGPNGVGKTVLLSCLAGSERPTEGEVDIFGEPANDRPGDHVAFLAQETMAIETLTGRENVAFYELLHPTFTDRWERYLTDLGLAEDLDKLVEHYSGGMKRKLELALTASMDVPIYLLDEPTAGVDLSMIQRFHDIIIERADAGATFVISSHNPMDADLADRIAFMPDGTITAVGTPQKLMAAVPQVVRVTGTEAFDTASEFVVDNELFPLGGEARGFLADGQSIEDVRHAVDTAGYDTASVEGIDPTDADLFNYYVHVVGKTDE